MSGFSEVTAQADDLQRRCVKAVCRYGMRLYICMSSSQVEQSIKSELDTWKTLLAGGGSGSSHSKHTQLSGDSQEE